MVGSRVAVWPLALAAIILALNGPVYSQQTAKCPPNTFQCKDGSCIPEDWVGDGEPDCDDQSDELPSNGQSQSIPDAPRALPPTKDTRPSPTVVSSAVPKQQSQTPKRNKPAQSPSPSTTEEKCPWEHQMRIDECSEPILNLLNKINAISFENSTMFEAQENLDLLDSSCELVNEYNLCIEGASTVCKPDEGVTSWKNTEMYICQLLVPSVKEHTGCFQAKRDKKCTVNLFPNASPLCRLVNSIIQDMSCMDKYSECPTDAKEMLIPIQMESENIAKEIRCNMDTPPTVTPEPVEDEESVPKEEMPEKAEKEVERENVEKMESADEQTQEETEMPEEEESRTRPTPTTTVQPTTTPVAVRIIMMDETTTTAKVTVPQQDTVPTTQRSVPTTEMERQQTTEAVREEETEENERPFEGGEEAMESRESAERQTVANGTPPTTTTQTPSTTQKSTQTPTAPSAPETTEKQAEVEVVVPPLADAVRSLVLIDSVCESTVPTDGVYGGLRSFLCRRKDVIKMHFDCFEKTLKKTKCAVRDPKTPCEAIEAFNVNLDCAIIVMNDECGVESQDAVVGLQEEVNDLSIEAKCFQNGDSSEQKDKEEKKKGDGFSLQTELPRCTDNQENGALACLVELVEINKQLAMFQNQNFLLEMANENSSTVSSVCSLYGKYEECLSASVFSMTDGKRCSFASPLNTLARIGLAPLCSTDIGPLLSSHKQCLVKLSETPAARCESEIGGLGGAIQKMLQGIHAEALLCKSFYVIRSTFECGEKQVKQFCDQSAADDLKKLKEQMSAIGEEEGCPKMEPIDLDSIIATPVQRPVPIPMPVPQRPEEAPVARPLSVSAPRPITPVVPACTPEQQQKFQTCVQPMTVFQPHPLSVIKMPRQIDEACAKFVEFKKCTKGIDCHPLWAKGMGAMFEYACGEGMEAYKEVRQCVRKISQEEIVKECVATFSRGAPQQACFSANKLLSCALGPIDMECGQNGTNFVVDYVTKFATAIDGRCKLASQIPIGRVVGVGCSLEEEDVINHCAAPLNEIGSRMEEMFQGGLNSLLKNVNLLAPVFAGGCNLTEEFKACAAGPLQGKSSCIVSNCMVKAGEDICRSADPAKAIDDQLSCVFGQVQEPSFAKCIRQTLSTIKQFTMHSFRAMLPKFVDCVEGLVKDKCGETPIKILRSISSPDLCPLGPSTVVPLSVAPPTSAAQPIPNQGVQPVHTVQQGPSRVEPSTCTPDKKESYTKCVQSFYSKYRMLPISLLNEVDNMDQVCADVAAMDACSSTNRVCMSEHERALKAMTMQICASRGAFDHHKICLKSVVKNSSQCMSPFLASTPQEACVAIQTAANCMAKEVSSKCGTDALSYTYLAMGDYARYIDGQCKIEAPTVSLETGCSEDDYVELLNCETSIDKFGFRPISVIGDGLQWDSFCSTIDKQYKPCIEKMKCKFEPSTSANLALFDNICTKEITMRDQKQFGVCLSNITLTTKGQQCMAPFGALDLVAKDTPKNICKVLNSVLSCAAPVVEKECGFDALLHVFDLHIQYANMFDSQCVIQSPEPTITEPTPTTTQSTTTEEVTEGTTEEPAHPKDIRVKASSLPLVVSSLSVFLLSLLL